MAIRRGLLILTLIFSGCASTAQHDQDMAAITASGAPSITVIKMQHNLPLELSDIAALSKQKVSDDIILRYLRFMRNTYTLDPKSVEQLRADGVSETVITYLLSTPDLYAMDRRKQNQAIPTTQPNRDPLLNGQPIPRVSN